MARLLKASSGVVSSLQDIAIKAIVARTTVYSIDQLPLPGTLKQVFSLPHSLFHKTKSLLGNTC